MPSPHKSSKPARKAAASRQVSQGSGTMDLSPGDTIEFSLTAGFKSGGTDYWAKFGATTAVRPGESGKEADERLKNAVVDGLNAHVTEIING